MMHMPYILAAAAALIALTSEAVAFDAMYERTPSGDIEVKTLPKVTALRAQQGGSYFQQDNRLFLTLFDYIKKNDVAMTVPVEAEIDAAEMRFFASVEDVGDGLADTHAVVVETLERREVVSVGLRGAYSEEMFEKGKKQLETWLKENPQYQAKGPAYAVYWNGPYVPNLFKRSEVHLPVWRVATAVLQASR